MKTPTRTFKAELEVYRQRLPGDVAALKIIDRWIKEPAAEKAWNMLSKALPAESMPTAEEFIYLVIERWAVAQELVDHARREPADTAKKVARAKRFMKEEKYEQAIRENAQLAKRKGLRERLLSQKLSTAARQFFMKHWSAKFRELCGRPLDEVVRVLVGVCFDYKETIQGIRNSSNPTTTRDRRIRPSK
jgi:hypothetical protein